MIKVNVNGFEGIMQTKTQHIADTDNVADDNTTLDHTAADKADGKSENKAVNLHIEYN